MRAIGSPGDPMRQSSLLTRAVASVVTAALPFVSPGLEPYRAFADMRPMGAAPVPGAAASPLLAFLKTIDMSRYAAAPTGGIDAGALLRRLKGMDESSPEGRDTLLQLKIR